MTDDQIKPDTRETLEGMRELLKTEIALLLAQLRAKNTQLEALEDTLKPSAEGTR
jgi:hypothetical protein